MNLSFAFAYFAFAYRDLRRCLGAAENPGKNLWGVIV
jgi:hypothetical protein